MCCENQIQFFHMKMNSDAYPPRERRTDTFVPRIYIGLCLFLFSRCLCAAFLARSSSSSSYIYGILFCDFCYARLPATTFEINVVISFVRINGNEDDEKKSVHKKINTSIHFSRLIYVATSAAVTIARNRVSFRAAQALSLAVFSASRFSFFFLTYHSDHHQRQQNDGNSSDDDGTAERPQLFCFFIFIFVRFSVVGSRVQTVLFVICTHAPHRFSSSTLFRPIDVRKNRSGKISSHQKANNERKKIWQYIPPATTALPILLVQYFTISALLRSFLFFFLLSFVHLFSCFQANNFYTEDIFYISVFISICFLLFSYVHWIPSSTSCIGPMTMTTTTLPESVCVCVRESVCMVYFGMVCWLHTIFNVRRIDETS